MAQEIERKFLVSNDGWRQQVSHSRALVQANLALTDSAVVRVRIIDDVEAYLSLKSAKPERVRAEFEYSIPLEDAKALLTLRTGFVVEKRRHVVPQSELRWKSTSSAASTRVWCSPKSNCRT